MITRIVEYTNEDFYGYDNDVFMEYEIEPTAEDIVEFIYQQIGIKMDAKQLNDLEQLIGVDIDDAIDCEDKTNDEFLEFLKEKYHDKAEKEYD